MLHSKKVGTLPVAGKEKEEVKRTNEIKTAIPLLEAIAIEGKEVSADALLTQRELADYWSPSARRITISPSKAISREFWKI